jgi:hypothetical protein
LIVPFSGGSIGLPEADPRHRIEDDRGILVSRAAGQCHLWPRTTFMPASAGFMGAPLPDR